MGISEQVSKNVHKGEETSFAVTQQHKIQITKVKYNLSVSEDLRHKDVVFKCEKNNNNKVIGQKTNKTDNIKKMLQELGIKGVKKER